MLRPRWRGASHGAAAERLAPPSAAPKNNTVGSWRGFEALSARPKATFYLRRVISTPCCSEPRKRTTSTERIKRPRCAFTPCRASRRWPRKEPGRVSGPEFPWLIRPVLGCRPHRSRPARGSHRCRPLNAFLAIVLELVYVLPCALQFPFGLIP